MKIYEIRRYINFVQYYICKFHIKRMSRQGLCVAIGRTYTSNTFSKMAQWQPGSDYDI